MNSLRLHRALTIFIAAVWLINGLFCKVLNLVPRHEQIADRILDTGRPRTIIVIIGILEILMALWIISRIAAKTNAVIQIALILVMNLIEFLMAPDLLLWGELNIIFAIMFVGLIYFNQSLSQKINGL